MNQPTDKVLYTIYSRLYECEDDDIQFEKHSEHPDGNEENGIDPSSETLVLEPVDGSEEFYISSYDIEELEFIAGTLYDAGCYEGYDFQIRPLPPKRVLSETEQKEFDEYVRKFNEYPSEGFDTAEDFAERQMCLFHHTEGDWVPKDRF